DSRDQQQEAGVQPDDVEGDLPEDRRDGDDRGGAVAHRRRGVHPGRAVERRRQAAIEATREYGSHASWAPRVPGSLNAGVRRRWLRLNVREGSRRFGFMPALVALLFSMQPAYLLCA